MHQKNQKLQLLKNISCYFFITLSIVNLIADIISEKFSMFDIIIVAIAIAPLLLDKKWIFKLFGLTGSLIFGYLIIAVFISHVNGLQVGKSDPIQNYLFGYVFALAGIFASIVLIYTGFYKDDINYELKLSEVRSN